jgi:hypothetical protein
VAVEVDILGMDINKFFQSKLFRGIIFGIAAFIILLLIFKAGTFVGFRKADFSYKWGENYNRNFAGPRGGFLGGFEREDLMNAHGVIGQIIKIDPSTSSGQATSTNSGQTGTVIIKGKDDIEKIIIVKDNTVIRRLNETVKLNDLKIGDYIVVIGGPDNNGQIEAEFIRLMPPPPTPMSPPAPRIN